MSEHELSKLRAAENQAETRSGAESVIGKQTTKDYPNTPSREMSIAEMLDNKIWERENEIRAIRLLRESLPISFLSMGCTRLLPLLK